MKFTEMVDSELKTHHIKFCASTSKVVKFWDPIVSHLFEVAVKIGNLFFSALPYNFRVKSAPVRIIFLTQNFLKLHLDLKEHFEGSDAERNKLQELLVFKPIGSETKVAMM